MNSERCLFDSFSAPHRHISPVDAHLLIDKKQLPKQRMISLKITAAVTIAVTSALSLISIPSSTCVESFQQPTLTTTTRHGIASHSSFQKKALVLRGGGLFASNDDTFKEDIKSSMSKSLLPPSSSVSTESTPQPVDYSAIGKWTVAYTGQLGLIYGFLSVLDKIAARFNLLPLPYYVTIPFFYFFNLKTSVFSLLPNQKTKSQKMTQSDWEYNKRTKPSWTPPGVVFALMWPLFVFGLRATTAAMVLAETGKFATPAIMMLMAHLSVGNLWNTVNNIERRLGPSVILLYALAFTKAATALVFYKVTPLAGKLLALTMTWLTAAAVLETQTWRINPDPDTGKKEPLYPAKVAKWKTKFRWES
jgi:translocator protein